MAAEDLNPLSLALLLNALAEDDPDLTYRLDTSLRERLQRSETWDPLIAELLERRLEYPFGRFRRRAEETRQIAIAALEGFREHFEATIAKILERHDSTIDALSN